jgi:hypothetical protein
MVRSILAIIAGFFVTAAVAFAADDLVLRLVSGVRDSTGRITDARVLVLMLLYTALSAIGGSYVTARLAPSRPLLHSMILGAIALVLSIMATIMFWAAGPAWYHAIAVGLVLPCAWLGATLYSRGRENPVTQSRVRSVG